MFNWLKNHPFAVEAFFETSIVLTFAVPKEELQKLIPGCLQLDVFKDEWAFIAMAMVQTKNLRPKGFPKFMGNDFFLIGYRVFVKFSNNAGKRLRGLYILKSETDKRKMQYLGNMFTHYNYTTTDISAITNGNTTQIKSTASNFHVTVENPGEAIALPSGSPFADWKDARKFAGPLPFTFTYDVRKSEVLIIEGVRENWVPRPIKVVDYDISFIHSLNLSQAVLANAFIINNIPYYWKKGITEQWKK